MLYFHVSMSHLREKHSSLFCYKLRQSTPLHQQLFNSRVMRLFALVVCLQWSVINLFLCLYLSRILYDLQLRNSENSLSEFTSNLQPVTLLIKSTCVIFLTGPHTGNTEVALINKLWFLYKVYFYWAETWQYTQYKHIHQYTAWSNVTSICWFINSRILKKERSSKEENLTNVIIVPGNFYILMMCYQTNLTHALGIFESHF